METVLNGIKIVGRELENALDEIVDELTANHNTGSGDEGCSDMSSNNDTHNDGCRSSARKKLKSNAAPQQETKGINKPNKDEDPAACGKKALVVCCDVGDTEEASSLTSTIRPDSRCRSSAATNTAQSESAPSGTTTMAEESKVHPTECVVSLKETPQISSCSEFEAIDYNGDPVSAQPNNNDNRYQTTWSAGTLAMVNRFLSHLSTTSYDSSTTSSDASSAMCPAQHRQGAVGRKQGAPSEFVLISSASD